MCEEVAYQPNQQFPATECVSVGSDIKSSSVLLVPGQM